MAGEAAVLAAWRAELERVTTGGGCIAGGEHAWLDSNMTMLRLSVRRRHPVRTLLHTITTCCHLLPLAAMPCVHHPETTAPFLIHSAPRGWAVAYVRASQEPAQCCKQCGVVKNSSGEMVVLPNMLGHFGPPTFSGYRGDGEAQAMFKREREDAAAEGASGASE